ncbi:MAG: hypothetical protein OXD43_05965 [Bacteroidetes bacterium]|nr:hypothetical protein [Bacteroidota bacterium]
MAARRDRAGVGRTQTDKEKATDRRAFDALRADGCSDYGARMVVKKPLREWAKKHTRNTAERKVLLYLVDRVCHSPMKDDYLTCFSAQKTISDATGVPLRTVKYAVKRLRERGLIGTEYRHGRAGTPRAGKRIGTMYTLFPGQVLTERTSTRIHGNLAPQEPKEPRRGIYIY